MKYIIIIFLCIYSPCVNAYNYMIVNREYIEHIGSNNILYLRILPQPSACIIATNPNNISRSTLTIEYKKYQDLCQPLRGGIKFIDGLGDANLDLFSRNYISVIYAMRKVDKLFLEKNNLDSTWHMSEIGYIVVNDEKNPWRWAVTFIKEINQKVEKKSFVLEGGIWMPQKESIKYYFAPFLIDVED